MGHRVREEALGPQPLPITTGSFQPHPEAPPPIWLIITMSSYRETESIQGDASAYCTQIRPGHLCQLPLYTVKGRAHCMKVCAVAGGPQVCLHTRTSCGVSRILMPGALPEMEIPLVWDATWAWEFFF